MTDDKQNAPQWADVASGEIMETIQTNLINRMLEAEIVTIEEAVTLGNDLYRLIASTYARHAEQRDMAVAEAVRDAVRRSAHYVLATPGPGVYNMHTIEFSAIDLPSIIASVTLREPERCVWTWNDRLMMYDTGCGVGGAAKGEAKFCPNCGRKIEVKKEADVSCHDEPERCVWTDEVMYQTVYSVVVTVTGDQPTADECAKRVCAAFDDGNLHVAKEADEPNKTFYTLGYGKEADDDQ